MRSRSKNNGLFLFFGKTRVLTDTLETHESRYILQNYAALKSIRRNLFTEAIRPQRDLEPFITPLMTSQCQHAQLTRRQGHLNLLVLSIIFQRVTCNLRHFAPFSPHFVSSCRRESLILKWSFAAIMWVFFFLTLARPTSAPAFVRDGTCLIPYYCALSTLDRR